MCVCVVCCYAVIRLAVLFTLIILWLSSTTVMIVEALANSSCIIFLLSFQLSLSRLLSPGCSHDTWDDLIKPSNRILFDLQSEHYSLPLCVVASHGSRMCCGYYASLPCSTQLPPPLCQGYEKSSMRVYPTNSLILFMLYYSPPNTSSGQREHRPVHIFFLFLKKLLYFKDQFKILL